MPLDDSATLLKRLCLAAGPSGAEGPVRRIVREVFEPLGGTISHDRLGSILCELPGTTRTPRIALDAHMDEVGFMVQAIDGEGRLRIQELGRFWGHVLLAQPVEILTDDGPVAGVIAAKPPHFLSAAERDRVQTSEQMTVDVGASSKAQTEALGIRVGDPIVLKSEFVELSVDRRVRCKAIDDRVGVAVMCRTLQEIASASIRTP